MSTINPPDRRMRGRAGGMVAFAIAAFASAADGFTSGGGRKRTPEMWERAAAERLARAPIMLAKAEEKRARKRARNLAQLQQSPGD